MELQEALDRFVVQLQADGRSRHTIRQYERHVRCLARWCADVGQSRDIADFGHEDLAAFLGAPAARQRPDGGTKKATSANALRTSMRSFFGHLHDAGYISENPARLVRRAICSPPPPRALSESGQERLLAVLAQAEDPRGRRDYALFALMLATGLRVGAAVAIDVEDVDLDAGEILVRTAKRDRIERVFLNRAMRDHLRDFIGDRTHGPLFSRRDGERVTVRHVQRRFVAWLQRAGIKTPASPHSLRHSFAMRIYGRTRDLSVTRRALGHRSVVSTLVYARADDADVRAAVAG